MPILNKLTSDLKNWNKPIFSGFGRAAILKMNALPRLLYILQTIPIHVPPAFFKTYKSICSRFPWSERKPKISFTQLTQPRHLGGIGLPDLLNCYKAIHLSRIIDWNVHSVYKDWVSLEASATTLPLEPLPWTTIRHIPAETRLHILIGPTLQSFNKVCTQTVLSSIPGPLTFIKLNPDFPPGMYCHFLTDHWSHEQILVHQFYNQGKFQSASHLATQMKKPPIPPRHNCCSHTT